jgi:hypothetical protein
MLHAILDACDDLALEDVEHLVGVGMDVRNPNSGRCCACPCNQTPLARHALARTRHPLGRGGATTAPRPALDEGAPPTRPRCPQRHGDRCAGLADGHRRSLQPGGDRAHAMVSARHLSISSRGSDGSTRGLCRRARPNRSRAAASSRVPVDTVPITAVGSRHGRRSRPTLRPP